MKIIEVQERTPALIEGLVKLWESSVKATHLFLPEGEIQNIKEYVPQALEEIPYGETRSYKQIAEAVGAPKACRAVGGANHNNPIVIVLPCHRVIGAEGKLTGYGGGLDKKEYLLSLERRYGK